MGNPKKILIFGSCGVGKTSLLNIITGESHSTSSKATGCTFETTYYRPVSFGDDIYEFIDTVGLNEGLLGTVSNKAAVSNLINLILTNKKGFNLLVMVIKCGRIDEAAEHQYNFFFKTLVDKKIPVILVVTHCENEESLSAWPEDRFNKSALKKYSMEFSAIIGLACGQSKNLAVESELKRLRIESKEIFLSSIKEHALDSPKKIFRKSPLILLRRTYQFIAHLMNWSPWSGTLSNLMKSLGFSENEVSQTEKSLSENEVSQTEKSLSEKD